MVHDVAIVGAGILGLAHAWTAWQQGASVLLLERDPQPEGASIRNFGMIWPIGQAPGPAHQLALRGRELWFQVARDAGFWLSECGSLHVANRDDEWKVLQEFKPIAAAGNLDVELLTPRETLACCPAVQPEQLRGSLWSPQELAVNPQEVIQRLLRWLANQARVEFRPGTLVTEVRTGEVHAAGGQTWQADRVVVCGGRDAERIFPQEYARLKMVPCKLQMLRTPAQPDRWRLGPHVAGGLTLRHYPSFAACPSLPELRARIARETPELDRWGIHVMAAQNNAGEVLLGDSHEYGEDISPFDRAEIDELILRELHRLIRLPNWRIEQRWHGIYAKCLDRQYQAVTPLPRVKMVTSPGGAGMTLAFAIAEREWSRWVELAD